MSWTLTCISPPSYCLTCLSRFGQPSSKHPSFPQFLLEILVNSCRQMWRNWVRSAGFVAPTHYSNSSSHRFLIGARSQLCDDRFSVLTPLSFCTFCNKLEFTRGHFPCSACDQALDFLVGVVKFTICHLYSEGHLKVTGCTTVGTLCFISLSLSRIFTLSHS